MRKYALSSEDTWIPPAMWWENVHPRRGGGAAPRPVPGAALDSAKVTGRVDRYLQRTVIFDQKLVELGRLYPADPSPRAAAVTALMTGGRRGAAARTLVDSWVAGPGMLFAVRVIGELISLITTDLVWVIDPAPAKNYERLWRGEDLESVYSVARPVRAHLAAASDADHDAACELLGTFRTTPIGRILSSYLAPTRVDWVDADCARAGEWLADESGGDDFAWGDHRRLTGLLLLAVSRVEQLEQLRGTIDTGLLSFPPTAAVGTILDGAGPEVAPVLAGPFYRDRLRLHDDSWKHRDRLSADAVRLLAMVPTDDALRVLCRDTVEGAVSRVPLLLRSGVLTRFPVRALRILVELEPEHPVYTDLLGGLLLGEPRLLPAVAASLPAPVRARAEEIVAGGGAGIGSAWAALLERRGPGGQRLESADDEKRVIAALAAIPTEEAFGLLVDRVERKHVRPALLTTAKRDPELAWRVLSVKADGSPVVAELLHNHVLSYPQVDAAAPSPVVAAPSPSGAPLPSGVPSPGGATMTPPVLGAPPRRGDGRAIRVPALPEWLVVPRLPVVRLRGSDEVLSAEAARALVVLLGVSKVAEPHPAIAEVRALGEPHDLAAFAWQIFEQWRNAEYPSKSGLAMTALALLGDDSTVPALTDLFPSWGSVSARVRTGMEVLAAIGTDLALIHLDRLSRKARTAGFRRTASERLTAVADARGLRREQLADRIVPDLGFDAEGRMSLDYGPRRFMVSLDEQLRPLIADQTGKRFTRLPRPTAADDRGPASYRRFAELKADLKTVGTERTRALEEAMVMERRWTAAEFQQHLVRHPLMWQLTRRLLWATFDADGVPGEVFRAAEDRTFADIDDKEWALDPSATVGPAHPWHLAGDVAVWAELFADYAVIQPFPQVGREVLTISEVDVASLAGAEIAWKRLFALSALGWEFDAGHRALLRYWPGEYTTEIGFDPGHHWQETDLPQHLTGVRVLHTGGGPASFAELGPIAVSEVLRDLRFLTS